MSRVRARRVWKQMVHDKFLHVVGLTFFVGIMYVVAPVVRDVIN